VSSARLAIMPGTTDYNLLAARGLPDIVQDFLIQ